MFKLADDDDSQTTKVLINEINKLLWICYTLVCQSVAVTTVTTERSFSARCRLKEYYEKTLNNVMLIHCYREIDVMIFITAVKTFIGANDTQEKYFGSF